MNYQKALTRKPPKNMPGWYEPKGELPDRELNAIGFTSGIGSMLIGAQRQGFRILGNLEWRDYYRLHDSEGHNTFIENFPGAFFARGLADMPEESRLDLDLNQIDLAMGHPECGFYSRLNTGKNRSTQKLDAADIPLFLDYVAKFKPRFFVMDDLPESFIALPLEEYHNLLPDYDLFPEWISNYHYGNPQKFRKRMFMIGSLRSEAYTFVSGEKPEWDNWTVGDRLRDISGKYGSVPNHDPHVQDLPASRFKHLITRDITPSWREVAEFFKEYPHSKNMLYHGPDGTMKTRPAISRLNVDGHSPVLTGHNPTLHYENALPLTIRDRARIQGFPDDFIFYGPELNDQGSWEHNGAFLWMVKQTGKAMPIEFNQYVAGHMKDFMQGKKLKFSNTRQLKPNEKISVAKQDYCRMAGYENQDGACAACWLNKDCTIAKTNLPDFLQ